MVLISLLAIAGACRPGPVPTPIDLLGALPAAERRAVGDVDTAIAVERVDGPGGARRALVMRAPARVTWSLTLPDRGHLKSLVALIHDERPGVDVGVTARVGIVGGRTYETLFTLALAPSATGTPAWMPVDVDLSAYSGWQWSLFYRPSGETWGVLFAADATPGGRLAWAEPHIDFTR